MPFMEAKGLDQIKRDVAIANRVLTESGLAAGALMSLGHVSMRVSDQPDTFVVKGRGYELDALSVMRPEQMVVCDVEGYLKDGPAGAMQPNEVKIHSCIYRANPEVQSVVHVHPRFTVVMSQIEGGLVPVCREGMPLVREPVPIYPHVALVTTDEEGTELADVLGKRHAAVLLGHGAVTTGASLEDSVMNMINLEEQAKMNWYSYCAAGPGHPRIPEEMIAAESTKAPFEELPHMRGVAQQSGPARARGVWQYYTQSVSADI